MKAPDTKTILNISLAIGIFFVGKKLMETFGLLKSNDDKIADALETASGGDTTNTTKDAPAGLALNPKYWINIYANVNKMFKSQGKPILTGKQVVQLLMFEPYQKLTRLSFKDTVLATNFSVDEMMILQKKYNLYNPLDATYLRAVYPIMKAKGFFKDNPSMVYGVFQKMKNRAQVSYLSKVFTQVTGQDLQTFLASFLNSTEMTKIANYLKNLKIA
jgi:hypothetical protein